MIDPGPQAVVRAELPVILGSARVPIPSDLAAAKSSFRRPGASVAAICGPGRRRRIRIR